jgi:hypothetical protein
VSRAGLFAVTVFVMVGCALFVGRGGQAHRRDPLATGLRGPVDLPRVSAPRAVATPLASRAVVRRFLAALDRYERGLPGTGAIRRTTSPAFGAALTRQSPRPPITGPVPPARLVSLTRARQRTGVAVWDARRRRGGHVSVLTVTVVLADSGWRVAGIS